MNKKYTVVGLVVAFIVIASIITYSYFANTRNVIITIQDAATIKLYERKVPEGRFELVNSNIKSGETVRITPEYEYQVEYTGNQGFASDTISLDVRNSSLQASADFSDDRLKTLYNSEKTSIEQVLLAKYPNVKDLYTITESKLYKRGQWYGALLAYKGSGIFNTDDLRVVMKKENGTWVAPWVPMPSLNKYAQKDVPIDVLQKINSL